LTILPHEKQIEEYRETIRKFKEQNEGNSLFAAEISKLEKKLALLKKKVYSELSPWDRVLICRHPKRPHSTDYVKGLCDHFMELSGDRQYGDDRAVIGGLARIGGQKFMLIGQEKGWDTESRIKANFGMLNPEGFVKARRLMRLAEKFRIPVVSLLDTPGAFPGLEAEARGQGQVIAMNLREMCQIETPIIVVVIGEAYSGGALGTGIGDSIGMLEHACYSVISPESCASILWKDPTRNQDAAAALKMNAENLLEFGVIDSIIKEPEGGAHKNHAEAMANVKEFILKSSEALCRLSPEVLREHRYRKFRNIGRYEEVINEATTAGDLI
jgi:acetyl-CoA carboxylase carboxyl transferase subunit alpha